MAKKELQILKFNNVEEIIKHFNGNYPVWRIDQEKQRVLALVKGKARNKTLAFDFKEINGQMFLYEVNQEEED